MRSPRIVNGPAGQPDNFQGSSAGRLGEKATDNFMKLTAKFYSGVFLAAALALCPLAQAQENTSAPDVSKTITKLEKQIQALQNQVESLKKATSADPAPAPDTSSATDVALATTPAPATAAPADPPAAAPAPAAAAPAPAAPAPATPASVFDSIAINGIVDGYYSYDFQHPQGVAATVPAGTATGYANSELAGFRAFDSPQETLMLNMLELTMTKAPTSASRLGFDFSLGYGNAMNVVNSTEPGGLGFSQYLKEAYISYDAPVGKGLEIDFGKFVTPIGAEVIESSGNWNYSRGILFTYAIPFYHFGLRAKYVFNDKFNLTGFLVNGWNNVVDNNTAKTVGVSLGWTPTKKIGVTENYFVGAEQPNDNSDIRNLTDTVVTYNPTSKLSLMWNFDYGHDTPAGTASGVWWSGIAGYLRYAFNDSYAFAARYEYYDDHNGFTTGAPQHINEYTLTAERTLAKSLVTRLEFRRDMASQPTLFRGAAPTKNQDTLEAGMFYTFDIHDAQ